MFNFLFKKAEEVPNYLPNHNYKIIELPNGRFAPMVLGEYEWRIIDYVSGDVVSTWCAPQNVLSQSVKSKKEAYKKIWLAFKAKADITQQDILDFITNEQKKEMK